MTYSMTCELAAELWSCDLCGQGFWGAPPDACWHGVTACEECACADCGVEARRP